jgi:hypothetical protein
LYLNKANNPVITLEPFPFLSAANASLDSLDGGELNLTFYNNMERDRYYWPLFDLVKRWLTTFNHVSGLSVQPSRAGKKRRHHEDGRELREAGS